MHSHGSQQKEGKVDWKFEPVQFVHSEGGAVKIRNNKKQNKKPRYDTRISLTLDPKSSTSHVQTNLRETELLGTLVAQEQSQMPMYTCVAHGAQPISSAGAEETGNVQSIESERLYERMFAILYGSEYTERRRNQILRQQNPRRARVSIPIKDLVE